MKSRETFERYKGFLRLIPVFVSRRYSKTSHRLPLHPYNYYALGIQRTSVKERCFSSVLPCMNDPFAPPAEGVSYVLPFDVNTSEKFTLKEAVEVLGKEIVGDELMKKYTG